jgi:NADPH2:quinone reductase
MLAVQCVAYDELPSNSVRVRDVPLPNLQTTEPGNIMVDVLVMSADFVQLLLTQRKYQVRAQPPFTLGAEMVGRIVAVGSGVERLAVGDLVVGGACSQPGPTGQPYQNHGAWAERVECRAAAMWKVPKSMDPLDVPSPYSYSTCIHALGERAELQAGETLLVLGASGGVGTAAIEIGKLMGATVIAAASSAEKLAVCASLGADHVIDYEREDLKARVRELTGGRGVDVVCDPVGGRFAEPAVRALAWRGRFVTVGYAAGTIPRVALNLLLLKEAKVVGSMLAEFMKQEPREFGRAGGEREAFEEMVEQRQLRPGERLVTETALLRQLCLMFGKKRKPAG